MDLETEKLGLSEAAELAGCSRDTIRRAAQKEELRAEMGPGVRGPQWWIEESDLQEWIANRENDAVSSSAQQGSCCAEHSKPSSAQHTACEAQQGKHSTAQQGPCAAQQGKRSTAQQGPCAAQQGKRSTAAVSPLSSAQHTEGAQDDLYEAEWTTLEADVPESRKAYTSAAISPPAEVYIELIDRLSRSERRSIELEIQLRQSQRLLTENAESITEKEALAKEAQAKLQVAEDAKLEEMKDLASELETRRRSEAELQAVEHTRLAEIDRLNAELESTRQQLVEATTKKPSGFFSWLGLRKKRTTSTVTTDKAV